MEKSLYDDHIKLPESHWWFRGRASVVNALLTKYLKKNFRTNSIVDVGSGGGSMVEVLKPLAEKITLLEPDEESTKFLAQKFSDANITVVQSYFENWQSVEKPDIVSLFDVLEHIENDKKTLSDIYVRLHGGGYLILTVPAFMFLWSKHDDDNFHKRRYTKKALLGKVREAGFEVVGATYFNLFLMPMVLIMRKLERFRRKNTTDFAVGKEGIIGKILYLIFSSERFFLRYLSFPLGVSIFCIAKKK